MRMRYLILPIELVDGMGRIFLMLFSFPFLALRSFLVGITQTKPLNMAAFTAVLVNIPMNGLLIFGFDMGISASLFAEMCSLAVLAAYLFARIDKRRYGLCRSFDTKIYPRAGDTQTIRSTLL